MSDRLWENQSETVKKLNGTKVRGGDGDGGMTRLRESREERR